MENMTKVSFDFDDTLSRKVVQKYAKELTDRGNLEVWIVTRRYDNVDMYTQEFCDMYNIDKSKLEKEHNHLFEVADECGISRDNIHFCNMEYKYTFFNGKDFLWHLDDDFTDIYKINKLTKTTAVNVYQNNRWKKNCEKLLNNLED